MNKDLFNRLAASYDQGVTEGDAENEFPFAGYARTLDFIAAEIAGRTRADRPKVLDLGIGTGFLETKFAPGTIVLTGVDISQSMLEIARLRHPEATLLEADFARGIPAPGDGGPWDVIVSTYAMHHFETAFFIDYLGYLVDRLSPFGKIYVGDVMFLDAREREACRLRNLEAWDDTEHYHAYAEIAAGMRGKLALSFAKTSFCAGVLIVEKYHELNPPEAEQGVKARR